MGMGMGVSFQYPMGMGTGMDWCSKTGMNTGIVQPTPNPPHCHS